MVGRLMTDEIWRIWKEMVMAKLRFYPGIYLEGLRKIKNILRIAYVSAGNRTGQLLNTRLECYRCAMLPSSNNL
jgi:hypothetical protein